jgi:uncharacterized protein YcgL (UPF0745 family)
MKELLVHRPTYCFCHPEGWTELIQTNINIIEAQGFYLQIIPVKKKILELILSQM